MPTVSQLINTNIIEVEVSNVMDENFDEVHAVISRVISEFGSVRILEIANSQKQYPVGWSEFRENIKFGLDHRSKIEFVAVVTDQAWLKTYVELLNPVFHGNCKTFSSQEIEQARSWIATAA